MQVDAVVAAGIPPVITVGAPGVQGATVAGMHGIGVSTPKAAIVAESTVGLAMLMHEPNVAMFIIGTKSVMAATGCLPAITRFKGRIVSGEGAMPNEHWSNDPFVSRGGMSSPYPTE